MSKSKSVWRFKTLAEIVAEGIDNVNWNDEGHMDYLAGTIVPSEFSEAADKNEPFRLPNLCKNSAIRTSVPYWSIVPSHHLVKVASSKESGEETLTDQLLGSHTGKTNDGSEFSFDIDRLAKEVDAIFQVKLEDGTSKLLDFTTAIQETATGEFKGVAEKLVSKYTEEVEEIFPKIKDRLIEEIHKGRTVINIDTAQTVTVELMDHPSFEEVMCAMIQQRKAMLVGPAGTGKTYMVGQMAERLKLPFYKYSCSRDSSVHDLLGYKQPKSEEYLETAFLQAYENGGIFLVDEYDAMSGDMALFFNGVADSSKFISIPHRDKKPQAVKHKDFYLVMCGNTWGKGSTDYSGRDFQDLALMDRFRFCRFHIGYHIELERNLMGTNYDYAKALRKSLEDIGSYLSTRNIEDIANLIANGVEIDKITTRVVEDLTEEEALTIKRNTIAYSRTYDSEKLAGAYIEYSGNKIPLEDMIKRYPVDDTKKLAKMKTSSPRLYDDYKYALKKHLGINI